MSRKKTAVWGGSKIQDEDSSESDSTSQVSPVSKKKKQGGTGKSPKKRTRASGRSRNQRRKAEWSTAKEQKTYSILLAVGILYPAMYDWTQMFRGGLENYFSDFWNYTDLLYIWSSIGNVIC